MICYDVEDDNSSEDSFQYTLKEEKIFRRSIVKTSINHDIFLHNGEEEYSEEADDDESSYIYTYSDDDETEHTSEEGEDDYYEDSYYSDSN